MAEEVRDERMATSPACRASLNIFARQASLQDIEYCRMMGIGDMDTKQLHLLGAKGSEPWRLALCIATIRPRLRRDMWGPPPE